MFNDYSKAKYDELYDLLSAEGYYVEDSTSYNDEMESLEIVGKFHRYQIFVPDGIDFREYLVLVDGDSEFENASLDKLLRFLAERYDQLEYQY